MRQKPDVRYRSGADHRRPPARRDIGLQLAGAAATTTSTPWRRFLAELDVAHAELGYSSTWPVEEVCYFRGQPDASWPLLPSLYRHSRFAELGRKGRRKERDDFFWQLESDLFFEFNARAREAHFEHLTSWDVLFTMQHHGVPTRLLDWTETFGVALYFAVSAARPSSDAERCIWMLNPFHLNARTWDEDLAPGNADLVDPKNLGWVEKEGTYYSYDEILTEDGLFDFALPTAIYPELKNDRIQAQRGSFTIWGDGYESLDDSFPTEQRRQDVLRRVVIDEAAVDEARRFLALAGIDQHLLFPDLAGLAGWLRQKQGFEPTR